MTIYISGPMTGQPYLNRPLFNYLTLLLRITGWDVINPVELNPGPAAWTDCMRKDIAALMRCESIVMLPGWEKSRGASIEHQLARSLGMTVYDLVDLLEEVPSHLRNCATFTSIMDYAGAALPPHREGDLNRLAE